MSCVRNSKTGWLTKNQHLSLCIPEAGSLRPGGQHVQVLAGAFFQAASGRLLMTPPHVTQSWCAHWPLLLRAPTLLTSTPPSDLTSPASSPSPSAIMLGLGLRFQFRSFEPMHSVHYILPQAPQIHVLLKSKIDFIPVQKAQES